MIFLFFFFKKNNSALGDPITPALEVERKIKSFILGEKKKYQTLLVFFIAFWVHAGLHFLRMPPNGRKPFPSPASENGVCKLSQ